VDTAAAKLKEVKPKKVNTDWLRRLQEILDELMNLTDWKKT